MRIQETDQILKDARYARRQNESATMANESVMTRTWKVLSSLPDRVTGMFRHKH